MPFFMGDREQNTIPDAGTELSAGPQTGFAANFSAALDEQRHVRSALGAEQDMATLEQQQLDKLYKATGERMSPLFPGAFYSPTNPTGPYQMDLMHVMAGDTQRFTAQQVEQMQREYAQTAQQQVDRYNRLASAHGLLTYDQMFKQVQQNAAQYVDQNASTADRATFMGTVGNIIGGAVGSFDPSRDPVNVATLALGGFGKTALVKIASEMGMAGLGQAAQLLTGGYENEELLNQAPTGGQMAEQVATTALGAGILRGAGEAAATGFRAVAQHFGARAADVTTGALAHEAEQAVGASPYGTSRAAQGMRDAEVLDALNRDLPMNMAVQAVPADVSPFAAPHFATSATDELFAGTETPLANIFDHAPDTPAMREANAKLAGLTGRVADADKAVADLGEQIKAREGEVFPARDLADLKTKVADLDQQIAQESNPRRLGQLNRDRDALAGVIDRQAAASRDLDVLAGQKDAAGSQASGLRIARARLVEDAAAGVPGVNRSATVRRLLGDMDPSGRRPIDSPASTAAASEQLEKDIAAPPKAEQRPVRIIPAATPDATGRLPVGAVAKDTVELGQHSGPVDLDMPIHMGEYDGTDPDGHLIPVFTTIRQVLKDHADDDALIKAMRECLI
ncbi:hypothetical protein [Mesorhizobium sp. 8]|uniref:hypothetical protein n=1 Tax=Mesorhizobium sp. 8 TaxID=2584466 RepID=UPI00111D1456|nr:hypothetical protein [Mesorhizobium sp. 8]QDB99730.1 hypothetical protein FGU64_04525 [Mesorhizobium sp. 8]